MAGHRAPGARPGRARRAGVTARRLLAAGRHTRGAVTDPHTLVGAYVMDAVTADDRASFEHHLAGCESCQAEVRGLREATARLAAAAEVRPRKVIGMRHGDFTGSPTRWTFRGGSGAEGEHEDGRGSGPG